MRHWDWFDIFAVCTSLAIVAHLAAAARAYGGLTPGVLRRSLQIALRSQQKYLLFAGASGFIIALLTSLGLDLAPPFPIFFTLTMSAAGIVGAALPPTVLFLGHSVPETALLFSRIKNKIGLGRAVHLLETFGAHAGAFIAEDLKNANVRSTAEERWQNHVHELMDLVPLIVLDARELHGLVAEEAERAVVFHREKTVFVTNTGEAVGPVWRGLLDRSRLTTRDIHCVSIDEAPTAVEAIVLTLRQWRHVTRDTGA